MRVEDKLNKKLEEDLQETNDYKLSGNRVCNAAVSFFKYCYVDGAIKKTGTQQLIDLSPTKCTIPGIISRKGTGKTPLFTATDLFPDFYERLVHELQQPDFFFL
jgi:hypothetical protein